MPSSHCRLRVAIAASLALTVAVGREMLAQSPVGSGISLPTATRVQDPGWWPTKGDAARDDYIGAAECGQCHAEEARTWPTTAMAHAGTRASQSEILRQHDRLTSQIGSYRYEIVTAADKNLMEVSDTAARSSDALLWAFGEGHMGQTYLYEKDKSFYESHLSFFTTPQILDITPGQTRSAPATLEQAAGRRMSKAETELCFGCHTTASKTKGQFDLARAFPGVTCESCHGPGAKHVAAVESGDGTRIRESILNPARLNQVDAVDFCGACHRTWEDVVTNGSLGIGIFNVRFAPYRLENSRCWKQGDARITCTACHDPHKPLVKTAQSYDESCLQCHVSRNGIKTTSDHPGRACPISGKDCVTCHMQKYEPPNLHSTFTDHWIRIVKRGEAYPN